jgi:hypothetical protein
MRKTINPSSCWIVLGLGVGMLISCERVHAFFPPSFDLAPGPVQIVPPPPAVVVPPVVIPPTPPSSFSFPPRVPPTTTVTPPIITPPPTVNSPEPGSAMLFAIALGVLICSQLRRKPAHAYA